MFESRILISAAAFFCGALTVASAAEKAKEYYVPFKPENVSIGFYPRDKAPVITVPSGSIVKIDGGGGARWGEADPNTWLKENKISTTIEKTPALAETIAAMKGGTKAEGVPSGHLLVGPIAVEDAEPGDMLEVRILAVKPRIPYGTVSTMPGRGGIPDLVPRAFTQIVMLDLKRNVGVFAPGIEVPLAPFMGVMGTLPPDSEGAIRRSSAPGVFGGNLDCKDLIAGTSLYLPVFHKGGLFFTGDSHAAQGDGEVTISAVETANTCTLQFIVHKGKTIKAPRAESSTHFMAFGLDPDLNKAMRMAITETNDYLGEIKGLDFFHAFTLSSIGVDFRVTQVVDGTLGIHSMIPKKIFVNEKFSYWANSGATPVASSQ